MSLSVPHEEAPIWTFPFSEDGSKTVQSVSVLNLTVDETFPFGPFTATYSNGQKRDFISIPFRLGNLL